MIDSLCLTCGVARRLQRTDALSRIVPIRASMYLLALINTNLGQGGVAYYLYRKAKIRSSRRSARFSSLRCSRSTNCFSFLTLGVIFCCPPLRLRIEIVKVLRVAYVIAWLLLVAIIALFAIARRKPELHKWISESRGGSIAGTFLKARPLDYAIVLAIKAPSFLAWVATQYFALARMGLRFRSSS